MTDRLIAAIRGVLNALLPEYDLFALHPGTIIKSEGPNLVDVRPDNARLPELVGIPVRTFAPGSSLEVAVGSRVLIGFEGGQRDQPVCMLWGAGNLQTLTILADQINLAGEGGAAVARVGDDTECTLYLAPSIAGKISTIPSAEPQPFGPPLPFIPFVFQTEIKTGSSKVKSE
jgi:hypothetical protein